MSSDNYSSCETVEIELPPRPTSLKPVISVIPPPKTFSPLRSPQIPKRSIEDDEVDEIIHRIHQVARDGNVPELEALLKNGVNPNITDRSGRTPLHFAVSTECHCTTCFSNAETCTRLLLETQIVEVNAQDRDGNTPLHLAIHNQLSKCAEQLISGGADVCLKNDLGEEPVYLLVKKLPDTMTYLLNECIFVDQHAPEDEQCVLKVDFSSLVGNPKFKTADGRTSSFVGCASRKDLRISWQQEMRLLLAILQNPATRAWRTKILTHPVVQIFMEQEWKRVRKFFWSSFAFYIFYVILYTSYIINVYLYQCPSTLFVMGNDTDDDFLLKNKTHWFLMHSKSTNNSLNGKTVYNDSDHDHDAAYHDIDDDDTRYHHHPSAIKCEIVTGPGAHVIIILLLTLLLAVMELVRVVITPRLYIRSFLNLGSWVFIALILWTTIPNLGKRKKIGPYQYQAAALTVFLAWAFMLQQIGRFPALGKYIEMFGVVIRSFGFFVLTFLSLFIAFALAFWLLFPTRAAFKYLFSSLLITFVMMTGEINYNTMFYSADDEVGGSLIVHILFAVFVFIVSIVLMNLVIGLTVQDIQKLQVDGELRRMSRLILEIHRLECFVFSKRVPRALGDRLKATISVLQPTKQGRREGLIFEFRPNSREDRSVPKNVKQEALELASASYAKFRANQCSKPDQVEHEHNGRLSHPVLLRRLNRQHYKLIAVQSSIYRTKRKRRQKDK